MPYLFSEPVRNLVNAWKDKKTSNLSRMKPAGWVELLVETSFLGANAQTAQRFWHVLNNTFDPPACPVCGRHVRWQAFSSPKQYATYCSGVCATKSEQSKEKRANTFKNKHGVSNLIALRKNYTLSPEKQALKIHKRKATILQRYGADYGKRFNKKASETMMERYGFASVLEARIILGLPRAVPTKKYERKTYSDLIAQYPSKPVTGGTISNISIDSFSRLNDGEWMFEQYVIGRSTAEQIATMLSVDSNVVKNYLKRYQLSATSTSYSIPLQQVLEFATSIDQQAISDYQISNYFAVSVYLPSCNTAIDLCQLYEHSTGVITNNRHINDAKHTLCKKLGIRLIIVYEDEWIHKNALVKAKIKNIVHQQDTLTIYARKCEIVEVSYADKVRFLDENHIQGDGAASISLGLCYEGHLVACLIFLRQQESGEWLLNRYAASCSVVGGFSKLLKYFCNNNEWSQIITFADLRYSEGDLYLKTGFECVGTTAVEYTYSDLCQLRSVHKFNFRRKYLPRILGDKFDPLLSETENTHRNGWFKIYNCGLLKFVLTK